MKKGWKVGEIDAGFPRGYDQTVFYNPKVKIRNKEIVNEAHAEICGDKNRILLLKMADRAKIVLERVVKLF